MIRFFQIDQSTSPQEAFAMGKECASNVVDYSGAMPATFSNESEKAFWLGFVAGESLRFANGFCDMERMERILAQWNVATRAIVGSN